MSQDLISKFENMSDRELLIAVCLKADHIEERMNKHSSERMIEKEQHRGDNVLIHHKLDTIKELHENHEKRISSLEGEKHLLGRMVTPVVSIIGGGISGWLSRHF